MLFEYRWSSLRSLNFYAFISYSAETKLMTFNTMIQLKNIRVFTVRIFFFR